MEMKECKYHPGVRVNCPGECVGCWCEPKELVQERERAAEAALKELGYRVSEDDWDGVERTCVDCGTAFVMADGEAPRWCPGCGRIFGPPRTREEQIKAMRLEELAAAFLTCQDDEIGFCRRQPECLDRVGRDGVDSITDEMCLECIRAWLLEETGQAG